MKVSLIEQNKQLDNPNIGLKFSSDHAVYVVLGGAFDNSKSTFRDQNTEYRKRLTFRPQPDLLRSLLQPTLFCKNRNVIINPLLGDAKKSILVNKDAYATKPQLV